MSLLVLDRVCKSYGEQRVLSEVSVSVGYGERMGVVGPNGVGKTTLLELAGGMIKPDEGHIGWARGLIVGHLRQELGQEPHTHESLHSYCGRALEEVWQLEDAMHRVEEELAKTRDEDEAAPILSQYDQIRGRYESLDGYTARSRLQEALFGMGFRKDDFSLPARSLSGGQRVRAALARLVLSQSDLLLLDEPTNHLDIQAIEWLEHWLGFYRGAVVMVAHDRRFLDRATNRTLELRDKKATLFTGNYTAYERQRQERDERERAEWERKQEVAGRLEDYIRRYKAGNRSTMAKSRERALERLGPLEAPQHGAATPKMDFTTRFRSAREVFRLQGVSYGYGDKLLLENLDLTVYRGQRLGIMGPNGCGKTTLLRLLAGELSPQEGMLHVGGGVRWAYYSQTGTEELPEEKATLDVMSEQGVDHPVARHLLARFGIRGDDVFKTVGQLSGGQKSRLLLACLVLTKANVLLLDEPTNHLDLMARDVLQEALQVFEGTLILVTHDRYLLDQLVDHLLVFEEGQCREFAGSYSEFRLAHQAAAEQAKSLAPTAEDKGRRKKPSSQHNKGNNAPKVQALEEAIAHWEQQKEALEAQLADPSLYGQPEAEDTVRAYHDATHRLEDLYHKWERALEETDM